MSGERATSPRDVFRAPKGTHDILPPESHRFAAFVDAFARRADRVRLRAGGHADLRAPRGVPAGGGVDRHRQQGDVRVRRQGRSPPRPAARGHGVGRPVVRRAPADRAVEGLVLGAELPLRAAAEGPLPPALAGRRRGRSARPIPISTSRSSTWRAGFFASLGPLRVRLKLNSMGDAESRGAYVGRLREYLEPHVTHAGRRLRAGCSRDNPLRILDSKHPAVIDVIERAPQLPEHLSRRRRRALRAGAGGPAGARDPVRARAAPRPRVRLLHGHHVRVRGRVARRGAGRDRRRRSLRRARRRDGRTRRRRASGSGSASSGRCSRATPRGCSRPRLPPLDVFVVDRRVDTTGPEARDPAARAAARGPHGREGLRRAVGEGAMEARGAPRGTLHRGARIGCRRADRARTQHGRGAQGAAGTGRRLALRAAPVGPAHDANPRVAARSAPTTSGRRSSSAVGSRTDATTAASCSSTSATRRVSSRSSSTPSRRVARARTGCDPSTWCGSRATCAPGPRERSTPTCRPARSRSRRPRSRCSRSRSRRRSRSTAGPPTSTRASASSTATSTCAARRCNATCGCGRR